MLGTTQNSKVSTGQDHSVGERLLQTKFEHGYHVAGTAETVQVVLYS